MPPQPSRTNARNGLHLFEALSQSQVFRDYAQAFRGATGLAVSLCPAQATQPEKASGQEPGPRCQLVDGLPGGCTGCSSILQHLLPQEGTEPQTLACDFGLSRTAVPVRLDGKLAGYLLTGHIFLKRPEEAQFRRLGLVAAAQTPHVDEADLRRAYFGNGMLAPGQHEAMVGLLVIFAQHLGLLSSRFLLKEPAAEPPMITKARAYIGQHQSEDISLGQVAAAVNTSTFYFCKLFKRATGINFTAYLARLRTERAKELLLNPNLRISEVAFEAGFQSLTHFNRVFKKVSGQTPGIYRRQPAR